MSAPNDKPMTSDDVFWLVILVFIILFLAQTADSCHAGWRYRDLRDRIQRLEERLVK